EGGVDRAVIGDVVSEVGHRRGEDRGQPNRVDTQGLDVVEPGFDAGKIAPPVAVRGLKRGRIDLVNPPPPPPFPCLGVRLHVFSAGWWLDGRAAKLTPV